MSIAIVGGGPTGVEAWCPARSRETSAPVQWRWNGRRLSLFHGFRRPRGITTLVEAGPSAASRGLCSADARRLSATRRRGWKASADPCPNGRGGRGCSGRGRSASRHGRNRRALSSWAAGVSALAVGRESGKAFGGAPRRPPPLAPRRAPLRDRPRARPRLDSDRALGASPVDARTVGGFVEGAVEAVEPLGTMLRVVASRARARCAR